MSIPTWRQTFMGTTPGNRNGREHAAEASLIKWLGFLPVNLEKHDVKFTASVCSAAVYSYGSTFCLRDKNSTFSPMGSGICRWCTLCQDLPYCTACPVRKRLGRSCVQAQASGVSYLQEFATTRDPALFIHTLRAICYDIIPALKLDFDLEELAV